MPIARKYFVAQWHPATAHHQGDVDLFAVRTMVAGIPALGLRVALRLSFEIGAGYVVQQQVVIQREQFAQLLLQVLLERRLEG